jgi:hypothetical protein
MGQQARERALASYDIHQTSGKIAGVYEAVLAA